MHYNTILQMNVIGGVTSMALNPIRRDRIVVSSIYGAITLFNAETGQVLKTDTRTEAESAINSVAWSPNGSQIASGSSDGNVQIWNAETLQLIRTINADNLSIAAVAWSPDSNRIVSGSNDGHTVIWNVTSGEKIRTLGEETDEVGSEEPEEAIIALAWRPNGQDIESSSANGVTYLWGIDYGPGEELLATNGDVGDSYVMSISYNTDGSRVAKGDANGDVYSQESDGGNELIEMNGHSSTVNSVCWSRDNSIIVSGSSDNTVRLWNSATGANLEVLYGHTEPVTSVAISEDNNYIFSASKDGTIRVWENDRIAANRKIGNAIKQNIVTLRSLPVRPPGHFGEKDPGGKVYQKTAAEWASRGLTGGIRNKNKKIIKTKKYILTCKNNSKNYKKKNNIKTKKHKQKTCKKKLSKNQTNKLSKKKINKLRKNIN
jgi:WD40 repeat protein